MENEKTWEKDFNWFDQEHYQFDELAGGSREIILELFNTGILAKWPNSKFGTVLKNLREEGKEWKATVKRFKTEAMCRKHCHFPSTYARTGELL